MSTPAWSTISTSSSPGWGRKPTPTRRRRARKAPPAGHRAPAGPRRAGPGRGHDLLRRQLRRRAARAIDEILALIAREQPGHRRRGPAFATGRYGLACGEVCARAQAQLGVPVVSGMHRTNPGADLYRTKIYIAHTRDNAAGMADAIKTMARLALKLHARKRWDAAGGRVSPDRPAGPLLRRANRRRSRGGHAPAQAADGVHHRVGRTDVSPR